MIIQDSLTLDASGLKLTRDGFLVGDARVSRAGNVQQYLGSELGLTGDQASEMFGVFRDPEVVFDTDSMMSLAGRPVTRGHPEEGVTADNWKALAKGQMGGVIRRDGEHVVAPMAIMDSAAALEVLNGARCLSAGYTVDVIPSVGVADDGTAYQFKQSGKLRFNHVAYLPDNNPRAGNTRVGDATHVGDKGAPDAGLDRAPDHQQGDRHMALKTITVDGLPVETTDAGEAAINKLLGQVQTVQQSLADAEKKATETIAAKDAELGTKDARIIELEAKVITDGALDQLVADRAALVTKAKALAPTLVVDGKSNADIVRAAVAAKLGDERVKDKPDAYVQALFDHAALDIKTPDPLRDAITDVQTQDADKAVLDARAAMLADLTGQKAAA